jgi:uncharacterized protein (DUF2062 family)
LKNIFKKYIPAPHTITENRWISKLGPRIKDPNLWHLNRRSVSIGMFAGVLCAFIPLPIQIFVAIFICFFSRGNLPVSVASTWISNPFTYIPLYYFCYEVGAWIIGVPIDAAGNPIKIHFDIILSDFDAFLKQLAELGWKAIGPLFIGCTIMGLISASFSFVLIRVLWRLHIYRSWNHRREKRLKKQQR